MEIKTGLAVFGAGCFWGVEAEFRKIKGVTETEVGYAGGVQENPNYKEVCAGTTGHAEAVRLKYDPKIISYEELLRVFWRIHDPTELNRQRPNMDAQYRSVIFYHNEEQRKIAIKSKNSLEVSGRYKKPIVTEIIPSGRFWRAEEYHQRYIEKTGR